MPAIRVPGLQVAGTRFAEQFVDEEMERDLDDTASRVNENWETGVALSPNAKRRIAEV